MNATLVSGVAIFIAAIAFALVQLWFAVWDAEVFIKLEITLGAFFLIAVVLWFTRKEYKDFKRQKNDVRLDD